LAEGHGAGPSASAQNYHAGGTAIHHKWVVSAADSTTYL
jgi:hypothetical protein